MQVAHGVPSAAENLESLILRQIGRGRRHHGARHFAGHQRLQPGISLHGQEHHILLRIDSLRFEQAAGYDGGGSLQRADGDRFSFEISGRADRWPNEQLVQRQITGHRNDFDRNASENRRKTAARVARDVDLARHQAADADDAAHHQNLHVQALLSEKAFLLAVIKRNIAQHRPGDADIKAFRPRCSGCEDGR